MSEYIHPGEATGIFCKATIPLSTLLAQHGTISQQSSPFFMGLLSAFRLDRTIYPIFCSQQIFLSLNLSANVSGRQMLPFKNLVLEPLHLREQRTLPAFTMHTQTMPHIVQNAPGSCLQINC